jgi:hypothetical protein
MPGVATCVKKDRHDKASSRKLPQRRALPSVCSSPVSLHPFQTVTWSNDVTLKQSHLYGHNSFRFIASGSRGLHVGGGHLLREPLGPVTRLKYVTLATNKECVLPERRGT